MTYEEARQRVRQGQARALKLLLRAGLMEPEDVLHDLTTAGDDPTINGLRHEAAGLAIAKRRLVPPTKH